MTDIRDKIDRRAFLRGMMLTSAGLLAPRPVMVQVPAGPRIVPACTDEFGDKLIAIVNAHMRAAYSGSRPWEVAEALLAQGAVKFHVL